MTTLTFFPIFFSIGVTLLFLLSAIYGIKRRSLGRAALFFGFGLYTLLIVSMTLFPIYVPTDPGFKHPAAEILARVHLKVNDFGRLFELAPGYSVREIGGNFLLWVPFGMGAYLLARPGLKSFAAAVFGFGFSFELGQLLIALVVGYLFRAVDINDVLLNSLGVITGWVLFGLAARVARWLSRP